MTFEWVGSKYLYFIAVLLTIVRYFSGTLDSHVSNEYFPFSRIIYAHAFITALQICWDFNVGLISLKKQLRIF